MEFPWCPLKEAEVMPGYVSAVFFGAESAGESVD